MASQVQYGNALLHKDVLRAGPSSNILNAKQEKANQQDCELIQKQLNTQGIQATVQPQEGGNAILVTGRFTVQDIAGAAYSIFHSPKPNEYVQYEIDSLW